MSPVRASGKRGQHSKVTVRFSLVESHDAIAVGPLPLVLDVGRIGVGQHRDLVAQAVREVARPRQRAVGHRVRPRLLVERMPPAAVDRVDERRAGEARTGRRPTRRCRASRRRPGADRRTGARPTRGGFPRAPRLRPDCGQPLQSRSASRRLLRLPCMWTAPQKAVCDSTAFISAPVQSWPHARRNFSCRSPSSSRPGRSIDLRIVVRIVDVVGPRAHAAGSCPAGPDLNLRSSRMAKSMPPTRSRVK